MPRKARNTDTPNYGLKEPVLADDHYLLGASPLRGNPVRLDGDWRPFLPDAEPQSNGRVETYNCTAFGTNNVIETILRSKGVFANYNDRALGIAAGTSPANGGNDPHVVAETVRKVFGAVDESVLPFDDSVTTAEQYYSPNPLPASITSAAAKWWDSWQLGHEWIIPPQSGLTIEQKRNTLIEGLKYSPLGVAVYAWQYEKGRYIKPKGTRANHWTTLVAADKDRKVFIVFDSYDGYLKELDWDYDFDYAKIYYIQEAAPRLTILSKLVAALMQLKDALLMRKSLLGAQPSDARLRQWTEAIKSKEGYYPPSPKYPTGTPAYRNNNPGNLRYSPFQAGQRGGFAYFKTYEDGLNALLHQLRIVCNGTSKTYSAAARSKFGLPDSSQLNLQQFYHIYAPTEDDNDPASYANFVANWLGVSPWTKVCNL